MSNIEKKNKAIIKAPVHQIINLDDSNGYIPALQQELFVADIANQCGNLLNWASDTNSQALAENLWKNKMRTKACERFQQLDSDEIRKLVDRDWRIMNESNKKAILTTYKKIPNYGEIESRLESLKQKLNNAKNNQ